MMNSLRNQTEPEHYSLFTAVVVTQSKPNHLKYIDFDEYKNLNSFIVLRRTYVFRKELICVQSRNEENEREKNHTSPNTAQR